MMITVQQKEGRRVNAYRLGDDHPVITRLIQEGKVICHPGDVYELFSQEAQSGQGELANAGDYLKIDSAGYPYPNDRAYFEENHRPGNSPDEYEQIPQPRAAWLSTQPLCPEVQFLIDHKQLVLNPEDPDRFFTAPLRGTVETAPSNAVLVFYAISRDANGCITDADFNFVRREEFDKTYNIICSNSVDMV